MLFQGSGMNLERDDVELVILSGTYEALFGWLSMKRNLDK